MANMYELWDTKDLLYEVIDQQIRIHYLKAHKDSNPSGPITSETQEEVDRIREKLSSLYDVLEKKITTKQEVEQLFLNLEIRVKDKK